jgi:carbonic anhydrase
MPNVDKLVSGFKIFKATSFPRHKDTIEHLLRQGLKPSTLVISCSDIRLSPSEIFSTNPGELYIVNNIGGLVPKHTSTGVHGILSAIEYAVIDLEVENIVVLGHAKCDGIKMMMSNKSTLNDNEISKPMKTWLSIASEARDAVKAELADKSPEEQQASCEHESIVISLINLMNYPYIAERLAKKKLSLFGWHFTAETGDIRSFNPDTGFFHLI